MGPTWMRRRILLVQSQRRLELGYGLTGTSFTLDPILQPALARLQRYLLERKSREHPYVGFNTYRIPGLITTRQ